jgi:transposase
MTAHPRAKLGLAARQELCSAIEAGMSIRAAARLFNVSSATAHKWRHRWLAAALAERRSLACLRDRSSRPHRSPNELAAAEQERICELRRRTGWGPRLIAGMVGHPHSTVHRALWRHRLSRRCGERARRSFATSGPARVICCTWTRRAMRALSAPVTGSPAIARSALATGWRPRPGSATTSPTRSSTTTPASPRSSCIPTRRR